MQDGTLERIGEIIDELTKSLVDELDVEQAAHDVTSRQLRAEMTRCNKAESTIKSIKNLLDASERRQITEEHAMAQIRGLLHG